MIKLIFESNEKFLTFSKPYFYCQVAGFDPEFFEMDLDYDECIEFLENNGWVDSGNIIIPEGTKFKPAGYGDGCDYIKIVEGPLQGTVIRCDSYGDDTSVYDIIKNYTDYTGHEYDDYKNSGDDDEDYDDEDYDDDYDDEYDDDED